MTDTDIQALLAEIKQLRTDFGRIGDTVQDIVRERGADAVSKAQEAADKVWGETRRRAATIGQEIEEKPFAAAMAAFGLGLLFGIMLSGRRS